MAESEGHGALTLWDLQSYTDDHDLPSPAPSATTSQPASTSVLLRRLLAGEGYRRDDFQSRTANHLWGDDPGAEPVLRRAKVKVECLDDVDEQVSDDETIEFEFETKPNVNLASGSNEFSHSELDNDIDRHSAASETRFQDCRSFDEVDSQIDEDGWFVDEGEDENEPKNTTQCGTSPVCTTPIDGHDSFGASKQLMALALSINAKNVFKRKNINVKSIQSGSANIEEQSHYPTNKKTRLVLDEIAASGSDIPAPGSNVQVTNAPESRFSDKSGFSGRNATSDRRVSKNSSIGRVGSLSLPAPAQSRERDSVGSQGEGERNIARTSNSNTNLPDVVPNQSQRKLKSILDQAVIRATRVRESSLAQKADCEGPNSIAQNPDSGKKEEIKKKLRPSERARILQRRVPPKPMPRPDALTVVALIPFVNLPSQGSNPTVPTDTPTVTPTQPTTENKDVVDEKSKKKQSTVGKSHMVLRSRDKNKLKKQNQTELNELSSQGNDETQQHCKSIQGVQNKTQDRKSSSLVTIPNPLYPVFRRIAPKPKDYRPERSPPKKARRRRPKKKNVHVLPKLVVPLFELVPERPATSTSENLPKVKSNMEGSSKPKPPSARRKQDPLSAQTKGEKWRQEESEVLIQESDSDHEEEQDPDLDPEEDQDQRLISLVSDDEGDGWEVVKMEVDSDEERNHGDQVEFFW